MKHFKVTGSITLTFVAGAGIAAMVNCQEPDRGRSLKLNQIQVIGTHNSYHAGIAPSESILWQQKNAKAFEGLAKLSNYFWNRSLETKRFKVNLSFFYFG